ncbi:hypothetical protein [Dyella japonica]|nr:hypothetical protein [Dyella japonica]
MATLISVVIAVVTYLTFNHHLSGLETAVMLGGIVTIVRIGIAIDRNSYQTKKNKRFQADMLSVYHEILGREHDDSESPVLSDAAIEIDGSLAQPLHGGHESCDGLQTYELGESISNQDLVHARSSSEKRFGRKGSTKCIILFLRPFVLDRDFKVVNPVSPWKRLIPFYSLAVPSVTSLDDAMAIAIKGYGELIAIGDQAGQIGATRLQTTEENWRNDFAVLAEAASAIIIYGSKQSGTAWETTQVISKGDWLAKSVFIFPYPTANEGVRGENFVAAKDLLRHAGCVISSKTAHGDGITFSRAKTVSRRVSLLAPRLVQLELKAKEFKQIVEAVGV